MTRPHIFGRDEDCPSCTGRVWIGGGVRDGITKGLGGQDLAGDRIPHGDSRWTAMMAGAAETFVAIIFRVHYIPRTEGPDDGVDWEMPSDGRTVDVKWAEKEHYRLLCDMNSRSRADIYVLVTGERPESLVFRGWATADELHASILPELRPGQGPVYGLTQAQLHPPSTLRR